MTPEQLKQLKKLDTLSKEPALAVFDELTEINQTLAQPTYLRRILSVIALFLNTKVVLGQANTENNLLRRKTDEDTNWRNIIGTLSSSPTTKVGLGYSL